MTEDKPAITKEDLDLLIILQGYDEETIYEVRAGRAFTWEAEQVAKHRIAAMDYWYRQGKDDGIEQERGNVIEWLRGDTADDNIHSCDQAADAIEAGEHLK